jgi:deoxyribodipyrimidine photolyase
MCERKKVRFVGMEDMLLVGMRELPEGYHKYKVFTPFYNWISQFKVAKPRDVPEVCRFYTKPVKFECDYPKIKYNDKLPLKGGRT